MSFCCNVGGEKTESLFPVVNRQLRGNTSLQLISNITTYLWDATNGWALSSRSIKITLLRAMQLELKVFIAWETIQFCDTFLCSSTFTRYCIKKKWKVFPGLTVFWHAFGHYTLCKWKASIPILQFLDLCTSQWLVWGWSWYAYCCVWGSQVGSRVGLSWSDQVTSIIIKWYTM